MRYFFHVRNGHDFSDTIGTDLPDLAAVRDEAVSASAEMLRGCGSPEFWDGEGWSMQVTDETGRDVLRLRFEADFPPAGMGAPDGLPK